MEDLRDNKRKNVAKTRAASMAWTGEPSTKKGVGMAKVVMNKRKATIVQISNRQSCKETLEFGFQFDGNFHSPSLESSLCRVSSVLLGHKPKIHTKKMSTMEKSIDMEELERVKMDTSNLRHLVAYRQKSMEQLKMNGDARMEAVDGDDTSEEFESDDAPCSVSPLMPPKSVYLPKNARYDRKRGTLVTSGAGRVSGRRESGKNRRREKRLFAATSRVVFGDGRKTRSQYRVEATSSDTDEEFQDEIEEGPLQMSQSTTAPLGISRDISKSSTSIEGDYFHGISTSEDVEERGIDDVEEENVGGLDGLRDARLALPCSETAVLTSIDGSDWREEYVEVADYPVQEEVMWDIGSGGCGRFDEGDGDDVFGGFEVSGDCDVFSGCDNSDSCLESTATFDSGSRHECEWSGDKSLDGIDFVEGPLMLSVEDDDLSQLAAKDSGNFAMAMSHSEKKMESKESCAAQSTEIEDSSIGERNTTGYRYYSDKTVPKVIHDRLVAKMARIDAMEVANELERKRNEVLMAQQRTLRHLERVNRLNELKKNVLALLNCSEGFSTTKRLLADQFRREPTKRQFLAILHSKVAAQHSLTHNEIAAFLEKLGVDDLK